MGSRSGRGAIGVEDRFFGREAALRLVWAKRSSYLARSRPERDTAWAMPEENVEAVIDAYVTAIGLTQLELLETIVENWRRDEYGDA